MSLLYLAILNATDCACSLQSSFVQYESQISLVQRSITGNQEISRNIDDSITVHIYAQNGISIAAVTGITTSKSKVMQFLKDMYTDLKESPSFEAKVLGARDKSLQSEYSRILSKYKTQFENKMNYNKETGQVTDLQRQVDDVKSVIQNNINQVIVRGDKLQNLEQAADDLRGNSKKFVKSAGEVKKKMWWSNFKMKLILFIVVFILLLAIILIICYQAGAFNSSSTPTTQKAINIE